jgi:hypothetical protein
MNAKNALLDAQDKAGKDAGTLLGRFVQEPRGDGYAIYQVVKLNKKTARLAHVCGIGDDWHVPMWGLEASVDIKYVEQNIRRRDGLSKLFGRS